MSGFSSLERAVRWRRLRRLLPRLDESLRPVRRQLGLGVGLGAVASALQVLQPWPLKLALDTVILGEPGTGRWQGMSEWAQTEKSTAALLLAAGLVTIAVLRALTHYASNATLVTAAQQTVFQLRCRVYRHLQRLSPGMHARSHTGDMLMRLTGDMRLLGSLVAGVLPNLVGTSVLILGTTAVMFLLDPVLALVTIAPLPFLAIVSSRVNGELRTAVRSQRRSESLVASDAHELLAGARLIQIFGRQDYARRRFAKRGQKSLREGLRARRLQVRLQTVTTLVLAVSICATLAVGSLRVASGALTPGALVVFLAYIEALRRPLERIARIMARLSKATVCAERVFSVFDRQPAVTDRPGARIVPQLSGDLRFEQVSFGYTADRLVVNDVSFEVARGELVALVGYSGAGKTSILNLLLRFYDPQEGRVLVDGHDVREFTLRSWRECLGVVLQAPTLFSGSIRDNVAFGRTGASVAEIERAVELAGAGPFVGSLPDGLDAIVDEGGANLSGGQRQQLSIARALLRESPIMIFDEPASGLDPQAEALLSRTLTETFADRTRVVIAHRFGTILRADRILLMRRGQLIAQGAHTELYSSCERYRRLFDLQFRTVGDRVEGPAVQAASPGTAAVAHS